MSSQDGTEEGAQGGATGGGDENDPPKFSDDPKGAYEYLLKCFREVSSSRDRYKDRYRTATATHRDHLEREAELSVIGSDMAEGDKNASKVPRYNGTEGGSSAEVWLDNLTALQAVQRWSDAQTLEAATLALHGMAGSWKVNEKEDNSTSMTSLAEFKKAFLERFSVQTSVVESIKLVADLRQGPQEKVIDFHERVRTVIMTFGKDRKARFQADNEERQKEGYHECLLDMIKMHFVGGLRPSIRQVVESKYTSLTTGALLLNAAKEAEIRNCGV